MKIFIKLFFCSILVFLLFTSNIIVQASDNDTTINVVSTTPNDTDKVYIKIIEESITEGDFFALPEKIKISTNNSESEVYVVWNTNVVNTGAIGIHRFEGLIKETNQPVLLLLNIIKLNTKDDKAIKDNAATKTKFKVLIDPGHGGHDSGAVGDNKTLEKKVVLNVSLKVGEVLDKNGITVIYTRTTDDYSLPRNERANLRYRCNISNEAKPNLYVSIHANSADNTAAKGIETYYQRSNNASKKLAQTIQNELIKETSKKSRGVKVNNNYYVLNHTDAVAVLTEIGFLSNLQEEKDLSSIKYQNQCAKAIAVGILKNLGINEIKYEK